MMRVLALVWPGLVIGVALWQGIKQLRKADRYFWKGAAYGATIAVAYFLTVAAICYLIYAS
jgi:hypothetical protein